jgi:hypothetical protein
MQGTSFFYFLKLWLEPQVRCGATVNAKLIWTPCSLFSYQYRQNLSFNGRTDPPTLSNVGSHYDIFAYYLMTNNIQPILV